MYVSPNFKTKKALREAINSGEDVTIFQPGPFGGNEPSSGTIHGVEGPHYPEPHRWYASVVLEEGKVAKVL